MHLCKKRPGRLCLPGRLRYQPIRQPLAANRSCRRIYEQLAVGAAQSTVGNNGIGVALRTQDKEARS